MRTQGTLVQVQRSGDESAGVLDYDIQNERVTLTAEQDYRSVLPWSMSCIAPLVIPVRGTSIACAKTGSM